MLHDENHFGPKVRRVLFHVDFVFYHTSSAMCTLMSPLEHVHQNKPIGMTLVVGRENGIGVIRYSARCVGVKERCIMSHNILTRNSTDNVYMLRKY